MTEVGPRQNKDAGWLRQCSNVGEELGSGTNCDIQYRIGDALGAEEAD